MERNHTIMQFFEWHLIADGNHWKHLKEMAPELKERGIDSVWLPPATKAISANDTGYGIYDFYDLGEFDQHGSVRTKYGTKDELLEAISACHDHGICVYLDLVMNHKAGGDEKETFQAIEVNPMDRTEEISEPIEIEGWTKFTFPNRNNQYSSFKWGHQHFNGTDYDAKGDRTGVFRIVGENKMWSENVDSEFGNYDYLMFANIDYDHPEVVEEMISWGKWLIDTTKCDGFRLDAIKHINHNFISRFAKEMKEYTDEHIYFVGEFWKSDLEANRAYLDKIDYAIDLFDVALHYKFHNASKAGRDFDLTTIFEDTLVQSHPLHAVTFVDNHDSQPNESLESWVEDWFKQIAYSLILLRKDGYPCVFYGDYYGIRGEVPVDGKIEAINPLLYCRYHKAYGEQEDYFQDGNTIGWVRFGIKDIPNSGCAVVISNADDNEIRMFVGKERRGETWTDLTGTWDGQITIEEDGFASFPVKGGCVCVWANPDVTE